ncbi:MAG: hypothetical protein JOZ32_19110 [Bryobacterales bacterium]|nr:hypothetical protein [Bryobacterales bacterium]
MALRSKPQQQPPSPDERRVNELIEKGGTVARDNGEAEKPMLVQLRLAREIIHRIDTSRSKRMVPPSRHAWILEALLEKLKAEDRLQ